MEGETVSASVFFKALTARYKGHLVRAAQEGQFVCVPQSCSLSSRTVTLRDVEHHILTRGAARGEFTTLSGRAVHLSGSRAATGRGFPKAVSAALLSSQTISVALPGGVSGRLHVYFLSRPLEGGNDAPASAEDLDEPALAQLLGFVRMAPDGEAPIAALGEGVTRLVRAFLGGSSSGGEPTPAAALRWLGLGGAAPWRGEGGGAVDDIASGDAGAGGHDDALPEEEDAAIALSRCPLALVLRGLISTAEMSFASCGAFDDDTSSSGSAAAVALRRSLALAAEADACARLRAPLFSLLRVGLASDLAAMRDALARAATLPPNALGVKASFSAADLRPALTALSALPARRCPLTVLHALRDTSAAIQSCLEASLLARGVDLSEVDFGTDDILTMIVWLVALAARAPQGAPVRAAAEGLPLFLAFVHVAHSEGTEGGGLQHSSLGYCLANWETAVRCIVRGKIESCGGGEAVESGAGGGDAAPTLVLSDVEEGGGGPGSLNDAEGRGGSEAASRWP